MPPTSAHIWVTASGVGVFLTFTSFSTACMNNPTERLADPAMRSVQAKDRVLKVCAAERGGPAGGSEGRFLGIFKKTIKSLNSTSASSSKRLRITSYCVCMRSRNPIVPAPMPPMGY